MMDATVFSSCYLFLFVPHFSETCVNSVLVKREGYDEILRFEFVQYFEFKNNDLFPSGM